VPATATVTFEAFERTKARGLDAYRKGQYAAARAYLSDAARQLIQFAESKGASDPLRSEYESAAADMLRLVRKCDELKDKPPKKTNKKRAKDGSDDDGADAADWIVSEKPDVGFDDIAGLEAVKEEIRMKMIYPLSYPEEAAEFGVSVGGGLLLYGPPGTGKTMIAKAIAKEIDATYFVVSAADLLSKWVGEAEQNIRKLFDAAKAEEKAVIFIDEVEALVPKRGSNSSTVMARVVPQILQELEGFDRQGERCLLFVGATNKPWMLDEAIRRPGRFDTSAYLGLPDAPARMRMLELYLGKRPLADDVDLGTLCDQLDGYSGADIDGIAKKAAQIPFMDFVKAKQSGQDGAKTRQINMADLATVISSTGPSVKPGDLARFTKFEGK